MFHIIIFFTPFKILNVDLDHKKEIDKDITILS
jgi:hypothetical protein